MDLVIDYRGERDMLSFNFNKEKEIGVKEIRIGDMTQIEAVV